MNEKKKKKRLVPTPSPALARQRFKRRASAALSKIHKLYQCILARLRSHGELGGELLRGRSVNPEFGLTLARRVNQSCFPVVLQSNRITVKFGTAEARRLNWA